jgi:small subunit ribosomal protein S1
MTDETTPAVAPEPKDAAADGAGDATEAVAASTGTDDVAETSTGTDITPEAAEVAAAPSESTAVEAGSETTSATETSESTDAPDDVAASTEEASDDDASDDDASDDVAASTEEASDDDASDDDASDDDASEDRVEDRKTRMEAAIAHSDRPAITAPTNIPDISEAPSAEDFAAAVDHTVFEFKEGDIVAGTVVRVDPDEVLIDIGYKSEGVIPSQELSISNSASTEDVVEIGDEIEALVMQKEDESGRLVLSKKRAQYERAWGRIERVMAEGGTVEGPVIEVVKGGLIVDIGLRGFLPASLVDLRRVRDLHPFIGETIEAKVIELDKNRNNVVLSRRAYLEETQAEQRHAFLSNLTPGDMREGVVSSVVNFGAFVDLGGMDGLVHVSELSWQHVSHPGEVVSVGDKVQIRVLEVDRERERISLSIRQTREDPWEEFVRTAEVGAILDGRVTKTVPFGAFVSVGEGVEGLVHVSEIAMHHVESPEMELSIDQQVRVKVTEIDADRRRVSLSIKQALPEWEEPSTWDDRRSQRRPKRREFTRQEDAAPEPSFNADASLEAILQELKERGIGRS